MLLRKRAWDIMREDYPVVKESEGLMGVMKALHEHLKDKPHCPAVAILDEQGHAKGLVTMRGLLHYVRENLKGREALKSLDHGGFENVLEDSCQTFVAAKLAGIMEEKVLKVGPEEPLVLLVADFVKHEQDAALVIEGERLIGMVLLTDLYQEVSQSVFEDCYPD